MQQDNLDIEILSDGTIRVLTSKVSAANHQSAEQFLQFIGRLAGGEQIRQKRAGTHQHQHSHSHEGDHHHA
jgi:hypothetical protein